MRAGVIIIALLALSAGCAGRHSGSSRVQRQEAELSYADAGSAGALAFDPPIASDQPLPDTSRDGRSPSAFVGYEESVTTVSSVYQRDEIRAANGDFDRRAYTGRTSVTTR